MALERVPESLKDLRPPEQRPEEEEAAREAKERLLRKLKTALFEAEAIGVDDSLVHAYVLHGFRKPLAAMGAEEQQQGEIIETIAELCARLLEAEGKGAVTGAQKTELMKGLFERTKEVP